MMSYPAKAFVALLPLLASAAMDNVAAQSPMVEAPSGHSREDTFRLRGEELDMLSRARAEHARRSGSAPTVVREDTDPAEAVRAEAIEAEVARRLQAAEREAELDALSEAIRRRQASRGSPVPIEQVPREVQAGDGDVPTIAETGALPQSSAAAGRATVLLAISPGSSGIRRFVRTADPILCTRETCWVSRGAERDARMMPRRMALGPLNTLGSRAGACNDSIGCVFRNVEFGAAPTVVQPIDLRLMKHDRREPLEARVDLSCRSERGALRCDGAQSGPDYRLWVVPEDIAQDAGPRILAATVGGERRSRDQRMR